PPAWFRLEEKGRKSTRSLQIEKDQRRALHLQSPLHCPAPSRSHSAATCQQNLRTPNSGRNPSRALLPSSSSAAPLSARATMSSAWADAALLLASPSPSCSPLARPRYGRLRKVRLLLA
uniref:Uncharacterized protein n=1 Tax=Aegilops tauschii subsp. strangulata TaxID=200361 RepID=A0A453CW78_AEGTS